VIGISLRRNALLLVLLTAVIAVVSDWSHHAALPGLWGLPAALLLLGLAYESWMVSRSGLSLEVEPPDRLFLGRNCSIRFVCRHSLPRNLAIELAPSAPDSFELDSDVIRLGIPPGVPASIERRASPSRLGVYSWPS